MMLEKFLADPASVPRNLFLTDRVDTAALLGHTPTSRLSRHQAFGKEEEQVRRERDGEVNHGATPAGNWLPILLRSHVLSANRLPISVREEFLSQATAGKQVSRVPPQFSTAPQI